MQIRKEKVENVIESLIELSEIWEKENICYGYVANTKEDYLGEELYVAYNDQNKLCGYLIGHFYAAKNMQAVIDDAAECFEVDEVYVLGKERNSRVGERLFKFMENDIKNNVQYISLNTASKNWKSIMHFYIDILEMNFWNATLIKKNRKVGT